jgi:hypothetical protein
MPGRRSCPFVVCVVTVRTAAADVELLSGPTEFGDKLHDPAKSGATVQLKVIALLYAAPTGSTLKLYLAVADCPTLTDWLDGEKLPMV